MRYTIEILKLFAPYLIKSRRAKISLILLIGVICLDIACAGLVPYYYKLVVDGLTEAVPPSQIMWIAIVCGVFWVISRITYYFQEILLVPAINLAIQSIKYQVIEHVHKIPIQEYNKFSIAEIISAVQRIGMSTRTFFRVFVCLLIPTAIKLGMTFAILIQLKLFVLTIVVSAIICMYVVVKTTLYYIGIREKTWQMTDRVNVATNDSILNTKFARFFIGFEMRHMGKLLQEEQKYWIKTNLNLNIVGILTNLIMGVSFIILLVLGVEKVSQSVLSVGDLTLLKASLMAAFIPFTALLGEFRQTLEVIIDIKRVMELLSITPEKIGNHPIITAANESGLLIQNLNFAYQDNTVIKDLNLFIPKHKKIAVMGNSGHGKSTLFSLVATLYPPSSGKIYLDGIDVTSYSKEQLNKRIHFIPQDLYFFNASLYFNLTYGVEEPSMTEIERVIAITGLEETIERLGDGLMSSVGEMGCRLSGGEKQRVALARALLLKPEILILDETTNALDEASEKSIIKALFAEFSSIIIISHSQTTREEADLVLEISAGCQGQWHENKPSKLTSLP